MQVRRGFGSVEELLAARDAIERCVARAGRGRVDRLSFSPSGRYPSQFAGIRVSRDAIERRVARAGRGRVAVTRPVAAGSVGRAREQVGGKQVGRAGIRVVCAGI